MINGTKLLNVAGMTRGRRDGILKSEKIRHVVKIGPMHLKGVWYAEIPPPPADYMAIFLTRTTGSHLTGLSTLQTRRKSPSSCIRCLSITLALSFAIRRTTAATTRLWQRQPASRKACGQPSPARVCLLSSNTTTPWLCLDPSRLFPLIPPWVVARPPLSALTHFPRRRLVLRA